jgi:hypothetical protein
MKMVCRILPKNNVITCHPQPSFAELDLGHPLVLRQNTDLGFGFVDGEFSSILASPPGFLRSLITYPRGEARTTESSTDLLGGLEINHQLKLSGVSISPRHLSFF